MLDLLFIAIGLAFLGGAMLYAVACDRCEEIHDHRLLLGAIVTVGLLVYLVYALIRPERF